QTELIRPLPLKLEILKRDAGYSLSQDSRVADVDFERLRFPLMLKKWEGGTYFQPLGMSGFKKISDFFVDEKLSIPEKESSWILYSGKEVVWIIGRRIDDRFKVSPHTRLVLRIHSFP
ncbi:MAG: tRNA lysidine(34) synthetase TilS C-terminal domain-containing protein, partial [Mangrovibacterium sp.]